MNNLSDLRDFVNVPMADTWVIRNNNTLGLYVVIKRLSVSDPIWLLDSAKQYPVLSPSFFYNLREQY